MTARPRHGWFVDTDPNLYWIWLTTNNGIRSWEEAMKLALRNVGGSTLATTHARRDTRDFGPPVKSGKVTKWPLQCGRVLKPIYQPTLAFIYLLTSLVCGRKCNCNVMEDMLPGVPWTDTRESLTANRWTSIEVIKGINLFLERDCNRRPRYF